MGQRGKLNFRLTIDAVWDFESPDKKLLNLNWHYWMLLSVHIAKIMGFSCPF